jgi:TonB family protein
MRIESWILSYLVNSLWQVPLLFLVGWIAARALRQTGPAAEHRVWVSVLVLQSVLPACSTLPWGRLARLLLYGGASQSGAGQVTVQMTAAVGLSTNRFPAQLLAAIAVVYGAICVYFAARFAWQWAKLYAMRAESVEVQPIPEIAFLWRECLKRFNIGGVTLAASSRISGPVTMGFRRKLVLLPADMIARLPEAEIHAILAHEFAHIRRNDFSKNLFYELLGLPVSYHPLFRLTRQRMMESREIVCDQMAAEVGGHRQYARSLLRLASLLVEGMPVRTPHALGIFDTKTFERRIMKLSEKRLGIRGVRRLAIVTACVAFGVAACGTALALAVHVDAPASAGTTNQAQSHSQPIEVSPHIMAGQKIGGPNPKYPEAAKQKKIQGTVVLNALIGKDGNVKSVKATSGPKELQGSAIDAVRQWKYKPYLLNGEPVEVTTKINVIYSLGKMPPTNLPKGEIPPPPPPPQTRADAATAGSASQGTNTSSQSNLPAGVMHVGDGVSPPVLVYSVDPKYTAKARSKKYQGVCVLGLIVDKDGHPQDVHVVRKLGMGLDEKAVEAVQQYRFKPAYYKGNPVPVRVNVEVNFKIYK